MALEVVGSNPIIHPLINMQMATVCKTSISGEMDFSFAPQIPRLRTKTVEKSKTPQHCALKDAMQRYRSPTGSSIYAYGVRYVLRTRYVLRDAKRFISYRIYRQVKYPIAEQYITKKLPEKEFSDPLLRVVLSYTVIGRVFVCQIPF